MTQQLLPKTLLHDGAYQIEQVLGQGGFGITYRAVRMEDQHLVAIKELFLQGVNERTSDDGSTVVVSNQDNTLSFEQQKSKFEKEARRLAQLDNSHIVKVYDFFEENDTAYYVMDYFKGRSLADLAKSETIGEERLDAFLGQLLSALETIHARSIWHLDIKPANILVGSNDQAVLIDFGASKHVEQGGSMTTSSALAYTPGFAPPEQMQGTMERFGPWTDFYALGATLYKVLAQNTPPTFADILSEGESAFHFPDGVSDTMRRNILWMMKPNRKERPQSVSEFLKRNQADDSVPTLLQQEDETALHQEDETVLHHENETVFSQEEGKEILMGEPEKKNTRLFVFAAVVLVAAIVAIALFGSKDSNKPVEADNGNYSEEDYYADSLAAVEEAMAVDYPEDNYYYADSAVAEAEYYASDIRRWDGTYQAEHCVGDTYGGTAICYETSIELWSNNDTEYYSGTISVDGWQIGWNCAITATAFDDNSIKIWIDGTPEGFGGSGFSNGDAIARLHYNSNGNITVDWFRPMIESEFVDQNTGISKR